MTCDDPSNWPDAPPVVSTSTSVNEIAVVWGPVSDVEGYHVLKGDTSGGPYEQLNTSLIEEAVYVMDDDALGTQEDHYFVVQSENNLGCRSPYSPEEHYDCPHTIDNLTVTKPGNGNLRVEFDPEPSWVDAYDVAVRYFKSGEFENLEEITDNVYETSLGSFPPGTHQIGVRAKNFDGECVTGVYSRQTFEGPNQVPVMSGAGGVTALLLMGTVIAAAYKKLFK